MLAMLSLMLAGRDGGKIVREMDDQIVAGIDNQRRRFKPRIRHVAVADKPLRIGHGVEANCDFEHAILALEHGRVGNDGASRISGADLISCGCSYGCGRRQLREILC